MMPSPSESVLVLTTLPAAHDAAALARALVEERLAACVNILPQMQSVYRWQGAIESETERQVVIKTTRRRTAALEQRLRDLHPYDLPEFIVLPIVAGSEEYLRWVGESVGTDAPTPSTSPPQSRRRAAP